MEEIRGQSSGGSGETFSENSACTLTCEKKYRLLLGDDHSFAISLVATEHVNVTIEDNSS